MNTSTSITESEIRACEKRLLVAFENKDLDTLTTLFHDDALLILPNGKTVTKANVLDNYRSGDTSMASLAASDYVVHFIGDTAVVSLSLAMQGNYFEQVINASFRYMRVWKLCNEQWQVIAGSGLQLSGQ